MVDGHSGAQVGEVAGPTGKLVATLPTGRGADAAAYDPGRQRVFSSNGADGTLTLIQQNGPDAYASLDPQKVRDSLMPMVRGRRGVRCVVAFRLKGLPNAKVSPRLLAGFVTYSARSVPPVLNAACNLASM